MIKSDELTNPASCLNKAKEGERLFVLLGRDPSAPAAINAWVQDRILRGKNVLEDPQIQEALGCARLMIKEGGAGHKRMPGLYYVRFKVDGGVTLAELDVDGSWWVVGCGDRWRESDFDFIGCQMFMPDPVELLERY